MDCSGLGGGRCGLTRDVVTAGAHPHFYDIALAVQEAGYRGRLYTGMYWKPNSLTDRMLRLPAFVRRRLPGIERLRGRQKSGLDPNRVFPVAHAELLPRAGNRLLPDGPFRRAHRRLFDRHVVRHLRVTDGIVHGSWGGSHYTFSRAKQLGIGTVLDIPYISPQEAESLWTTELSRLGFRHIRNPLDRAERHHYGAELELSDLVVVGLERYRRSALLAGARGDKIRVVPYGFDTSRFNYVDRPARSTFTILYVGPINPTKGLHYLIEAFGRAAIRRGILHLVGSIDPATAAYFEPAIARLGSKVVHDKWIMHAELARAYEAADVFAFPSMVGGIGVAVCEAMATGLAVITTDGDVVLRDAVDGCVVPERDAESLASALENLAADRERRMDLGRSASRRVKLFTREAFRRNVIDAYRSLDSSEVQFSPAFN